MCWQFLCSSRWPSTGGGELDFVFDVIADHFVDDAAPPLTVGLVVELMRAAGDGRDDLFGDTEVLVPFHAPTIVSVLDNNADDSRQCVFAQRAENDCAFDACHE